MRRKRDLRHALALGLCLFSACSIDEFRNAQRKSRAECEKLGGTPITADYCLLTGRDAGLEAGAADAAMPHADTGTPLYMHCSEEGQTELCYEGDDPSTSLQPPCRAGSRSCHDGLWGPCEQQVLPTEEGCNGQDDDCDGKTDEQLGSAECTVADAEGECSRGASVCVSGQSECLQLNHPQTDACNGKDDDCDGETDEGTELSCYPAATGCEEDGHGGYLCRGTCLAGERRCIDGAYADACEGSIAPDSMERCTAAGSTARDEDCDGQVDEGCACNDGTKCYTGSPAQSQQRAPCRAGMQVCSDPTHGTCTDEVTPQVEDCSNPDRDDDCNGVVDDIAFLGASCAEQSDALGACKSGARWQCKDGQQTCVDAEATTEVCDGQGVDEDCDGTVDEGFLLDTDENNCGACGVICGDGLTCCARKCVNTQSSNTHCSSCGSACTSGRTCCSGGCVDTKSDDKNCGGCGRVCNALLSSCNAGSCPLL